MKVAAEFKAALPEPQVILGLRLLPLSIGRYRLLKRFDSPFVNEESVEIAADEASLKGLIGDLFFSLIICGLTVKEFEDAILLPDALALQAELFLKNAQEIIDSTKDFNILEHINQFKSYLDEACALPWHIISASTNPSPSASHWSHSIEVILRAKLGWSELAIEEKPLSKAMADFYKYLEFEGSVVLVTHEDYAEMQALGDENAAALEAAFK